jgi:hypothetical protein
MMLGMTCWSLSLLPTASVELSSEKAAPPDEFLGVIDDVVLTPDIGRCLSFGKTIDVAEYEGVLATYMA